VASTYKIKRDGGATANCAGRSLRSWENWLPRLHATVPSQDSTVTRVADPTSQIRVPIERSSQENREVNNDLWLSILSRSHELGWWFRETALGATDPQASPVAACPPIVRRPLPSLGWPRPGDREEPRPCTADAVANRITSPRLQPVEGSGAPPFS